MTHVKYQIVRHDDGWAYTVNGAFSEPFPTHAEALAAARTAAAEQRVPGHTEIIEYEDEHGHWHTETAAGRDRPETEVQDTNFCDGAEMTRKRGARAGYVSVAIDASRQPFTLTFLASFSTAVLILICNHFGLVDLAAVDPLAWESTISGALGSSALAISEIFGDLVSFHRKERLLASWQKNGFRSTRTAISRSTSWLSAGGAPFVAGGSPTAAGRSSNFAGGRSARPRLWLVAGKA